MQIVRKNRQIFCKLVTTEEILLNYKNSVLVMTGRHRAHHFANCATVEESFMFDRIRQQCRPVRLEDRPVIDAIRFETGHALSAHAFPSLYVWQKEMALSLYVQRDFFSVKADKWGDNTWFFPCGNEKSVRSFLQEGMDTPDFTLLYLRPCDAQWLAEQFPGVWKVRREERADEYICRISEYLAMEGGRYAELRKKLRHLEREYHVQVREITKTTLPDAYQVLRQWREILHHISEENVGDRGVSEIALEHWDQLSLFGSILYLDGQPAAFYAGFPLDGETMDVLVGKCVPDAPNYTVYFAMREFLRQHGGGYTYCNLEEDLGIPGIRMVKQKMRPFTSNEIWEAMRT